MAIAWVFLIILIFLLIFFLAMYCAVFLKVLNLKLSTTILYLELRNKVQPKIKTVAFLVMLNVSLKKQLVTITSTPDKKLVNIFKSKTGHEKITIDEIKRVKSKASELLHTRADTEFISFDEVKEILKKEGLYSFLFSLKRSTLMYNSHEQQELYIDSKEVNGTYNLLFKKINNLNEEQVDTKKNTNMLLIDSLAAIREKNVNDYLDKILFS